MKTKFAALVVAAVASIFWAPHIVSGQDADIAGEWVTNNPRTRGITRIEVSRSESGWSVRAFGKCHPNDCDWGWVPVLPVGRSVEDHSFATGFAIWDPGFSTKFVTMARTGDGLTVEIVNIFNDRSGRANFRAREILKRHAPPE